MERSLLIVDDDPRIRTSLARALGDERTEVRTAEDGERALALLDEESAGVVLADLKMPGMSGLDLLRLLRQRMPDVDVILMTAYEDLPTVAEAMREGAADFLVKPLDLHQLRRVLDRAFEDRAAREAARWDESVPDVSDRLVGRDQHMVEIFKLVGQVAATRTNVVIRGESGTGKELIARAIHDASPFAAEPFVAVDCTALPSTLLESELFGHVRGAFTGATSDRRGRFALAGRGTVFLDEIGDTTPEFQSKLLRVLQEHEYYPVGAERAERTEARVIAATHQDLERLVAAGKFREDLYYRLRVVEIEVPPLRERMSDLQLLAEHFVAKAAAASGGRRPVLAAEPVDKLVQHSWPGNVRELENCLTRAAVLATGDVIRPEHVELGAPVGESGPRLTSLEEAERDHIARVLEATRGHKSRAAEILAISRPRLDRLIEKHDLGPLIPRRGESAPGSDPDPGSDSDPTR
ncbi:MAG: sigma-54-dependent Fis family transcriptional regulator [Gemmatimonadota bacterium]|nr:MAG: sigma-54-dependent Fis family transcriptional regulator [Gemmatimonadota bacterium]